MPLFIIINEHVSNTVVPKRGEGKSILSKMRLHMSGHMYVRKV